MSDFVYARNKATKELQRIPEHWLTHPVLGGDYEALDGAADTAAPANAGAVSTTTGKKVK